MGQRLDLHQILRSLLGSGNVYFQQPSTVSMKYPCIIYKRNDIRTIFADNSPYRHAKRYQVTVVTSDPDSDIPQKVAELPMCTFDRFYTADNLNHDVYNLFF
jgi:hypothetical protein